MATIDIDCQGQEPGSISRPGIPYAIYRFFWYLKTEGVVRTGQRTGCFVRALLSKTKGTPKRTATPAPPLPGEVLNLQPGELVEVKSLEEIQATLDEKGKCKGMQFMDNMQYLCGKRFRVYKRLGQILFEESQQRRRMKNTVLLEGAICDGMGVGCDRSCFFFWREAWLKRVEGDEAGVEPARIGEGRPVPGAQILIQIAGDNAASQGYQNKAGGRSS